MPIFISSFLEGVVLRGILMTYRVEIRNLETLHQLSQKGPCILACWHNRLALFAYAVSRWAKEIPFSAVISKSNDGEILAAVIKSMPNLQAIRVPHDARHKALRQIIQTLKEENRVLLVTPDGPKGPRYRSKPGAVVAAEAANATLITASWSATSFWQLGSWDRMVLPMPFSHIVLAISDPVDLGPEGSLKDRRERLDAALIQHDERVCEIFSKDPKRWPK
jgi:lysophospholipid acyltransferase (LPLAT)-like uncharacterized protein